MAFCQEMACHPQLQTDVQKLWNEMTYVMINLKFMHVANALTSYDVPIFMSCEMWFIF